MRKFLPLPLIFLALFVSAWSPADVLPVYKNLRASVVVQLAELFDREISVESVSGLLVNQIELNGVSIAKGKKLSDGAIIKAEKIVLHYNPIKLAATRGNIIAAISKIEIIRPEVFVERSISDQWNVASLLPVSKSARGKPSPVTISADIIIKDGFGIYMDHEGWGEDLKGVPFVSKFRDANANIKVAGSKITLTASATSIVDKAVAYAKVSGNVNARTGKYRFVVDATNVDVAKWGYYTMNIPHFKAVSGISDMVLEMTNPPPRKKACRSFLTAGST